jgi:hypothetical protein
MTLWKNKTKKWAENFNKWKKNDLVRSFDETLKEQSAAGKEAIN